MYVCLSACVRACMLDREVYKEKKHPTFEWEVVICGELPKTKQKMKQYFAVREMLPNKM